jgi:hypothetical protein
MAEAGADVTETAGSSGRAPSSDATNAADIVPDEEETEAIIAVDEHAMVPSFEALVEAGARTAVEVIAMDAATATAADGSRDDDEGSAWLPDGAPTRPAKAAANGLLPAMCMERLEAKQGNGPGGRSKQT